MNPHTDSAAGREEFDQHTAEVALSLWLLIVGIKDQKRAVQVSLNSGVGHG
jgi:hypothetical protein